MSPRVPSSLVLLLLASGGAGCASPSVREGIWKLTFQIRDLRSQESLTELLEAEKVRYLKVRVEVEPGEDAGEEELRVTPLEGQSLVGKVAFRALEPMLGAIHTDRREIRLTGQDRSWFFQLKGQAVDAEKAKGNFEGRAKIGDVIVEGFWAMAWVDDG